MIESEIVIIGGGIAGVSTAYHLALYGHDVTLMERGSIAGEASGLNAGNIGATGWGSLPNLNSHLTMGSLEIFKTLQLDLHYDIEFRQCGALQAIQTEDQYDFARDRVLLLRSQGYNQELLTAREARAIEPGLNPDLLGLVYTPLRAQADPEKATRAMASAAQAQGASILTHHEVTSVCQLGDGTYQVWVDRDELRGDEFRAATLVIAAGPWCRQVGEMLGLSIPIVPVRGQMWATEPLPPLVFQTISATESPLHWHETPGGGFETPPELTHQGGLRVTRHLYGRQNHNGEIIFGGDRQLAGYQQVPDATGIEVNRGHAAEILPMLNRLPIRRTWAGLMPFSPDGEPVIGKIPQRDNLFILTGLGSSGFGRGPMAGKLLADYIHTGDRPLVLAEADPARCVTAAE